MTTTTNILLVALILVALCGSSDAGRYGKRKGNWPVSRGRHVGKSRGHSGGWGKKFWPKKHRGWGKKFWPIKKSGRGCHSNCTCTVFGDPHMQKFVGGVFRLPLPCAHTLAHFRTKRRGRRCACKVRINGRAVFADPNGLNGKSFERLIHVRVDFKRSVFTAIFDGLNTPVTGLTGPDQTLAAAGIIEQRVPAQSGYNYVYKIPKCRINLKYVPHAASFTLNISGRVIDNKGLCGKCPGRTVTENNPERMNLRSLIRYLNPFSPIDNSNMDIYPVCSDLYSTAQNCSPDTNQFPLIYCSLILNDEVIRNCLKNKLSGNLAVLSNFEQCYKTTCTDGKAATCAGPDQFYHGCASPQNITDACT